MPASVRVGAVVVLAAAFAAAVTTVAPVRSWFFNADILLPAALSNDLLRHAGTAARFQLPRVTSIVPDLVVFTALVRTLGSWRLAYYAYAILSFTSMVLVCGAIVSRFAPARLATACLGVLALTVLGLLFDLAFNGGSGAPGYVFLPVIHSGPLILALAGLVVADRVAGGARGLAGAGLVAIGAAGALSDRMFIGAFLLPLLAGAGLAVWRGRLGLRPGAWCVALGAAGCAAGVALDWAVFPALLLRQPDRGINVGRQLAALPAMLADSNVWFAGLCMLVVLGVPAVRRRMDRAALFWWGAGGATVIGFMGLLPLLYEDRASSRYVQPVWWWAVIVLAVLLLRWSRATAWVGALATGAAALWVLGAEPPSIRAIGRWEAPLERCVSRLQREERLHEGLAGYWTARELEASSDWRLQVAQVTGDGRIMLWGNNRTDYDRLRADPARRPAFDFVVMRDLDEDRIRLRFGVPDLVLDCPDSDVWVYRRGAGLRGKIEG